MPRNVTHVCRLAMKKTWRLNAGTKELVFFHFQSLIDKIADQAPLFTTNYAGVVKVDASIKSCPVVFLRCMPE